MDLLTFFLDFELVFTNIFRCFCCFKKTRNVPKRTWSAEGRVVFWRGRIAGRIFNRGQNAVDQNDIFLPIRGPNRSRKHTSSHYFIITDWPFSKVYFSIIAKSNIQFMNYLALDDNCPIIKKRSRWFICFSVCLIRKSRFRGSRKFAKTCSPKFQFFHGVFIPMIKGIFQTSTKIIFETW